eukprot:TRINITY_DN56522_c0_g1_i1.p1 TRINITY_DN56522_c0_g1~~TRINITY_DN56522_c0_g1_i1.p1  ORF type:complete len:162 (+),score=12.49 TRINITY_DN56522_c0_g1_i1:57-542(+)
MPKGKRALKKQERSRSHKTRRVTVKKQTKDEKSRPAGFDIGALDSTLPADQPSNTSLDHTMAAVPDASDTAAVPSLPRSRAPLSQAGTYATARTVDTDCMRTPRGKVAKRKFKAAVRAEGFAATFAKKSNRIVARRTAKHMEHQARRAAAMEAGASAPYAG